MGIELGAFQQGTKALYEHFDGPVALRHDRHGQIRCEERVGIDIQRPKETDQLVLIRVLRRVLKPAFIGGFKLRDHRARNTGDRRKIILRQIRFEAKPFQRLTEEASVEVIIPVVIDRILRIYSIFLMLCTRCSLFRSHSVQYSLLRAIITPYIRIL